MGRRPAALLRRAARRQRLAEAAQRFCCYKAVAGTRGTAAVGSQIEGGVGGRGGNVVVGAQVGSYLGELVVWVPMQVVVEEMVRC